MNMKRIVFKIAKSFCACFITLLFFSCSNSESVMEKERKSTVIIDIKQNGLGYELKSKEVPLVCAIGAGSQIPEASMTM
mgnify:CR=1 FL=1